MIGALEFCAGTVLCILWFATLKLVSDGCDSANDAATAPLTPKKVMLVVASFVARCLLTLAAAYLPIRLFRTDPWLLTPYVAGSFILGVTSQHVDLKACLQDAVAFLADLCETTSEVQVDSPDNTRYPQNRVDRHFAIGSSNPPIHHIDGFKWRGSAADRPSRAADVPQVGSDEHEEEVQTCTICLSDFRRGTLVAVMPCGHMFHKNCVSRWLARSLTCVNCRRQFEWGLTAKSRPARHARPQRA